MSAISNASRILVLIGVLFVCLSVAGVLVGFVGDGHGPAPAPEEQDGPVEKENPAEQAKFFLVILGVCSLETLVLAYPILRSRWSAWRLTGAVFLAVFGVEFFLPQMEAVFFGVLSGNLVTRVLLMGTIMAALFSPLAVWILGRWKPTVTDLPLSVRMSTPEWIWKLAAIAVIYLFLYTTFGAFIAWRSPEVRSYYIGLSSGTAFEHGLSLLIPFQILRGLLWVVVALPVLRMMRGRFWESGLAVGLLFAVLMNAQLLLPNPYMPEGVRWLHLIETAPSNFLLGWCIAWLFYRHHASFRDLFRGKERCLEPT
ncbi:MAG: hypothetical protein O6947_06530 [Acidobacteria bacterium]|nr:hypothetical protein [Acidobacteriota bacterium]